MRREIDSLRSQVNSLQNNVQPPEKAQNPVDYDQSGEDYLFAPTVSSASPKTPAEGNHRSTNFTTNKSPDFERSIDTQNDHAMPDLDPVRVRDYFNL